jgi:hypothetical protein
VNFEAAASGLDSVDGALLLRPRIQAKPGRSTAAGRTAKPIPPLRRTAGAGGLQAAACEAQPEGSGILAQAECAAMSTMHGFCPQAAKLRGPLCGAPRARWAFSGHPHTMKLLHCSQCGSQVYFDSNRCNACGYALGFVAEESTMAAFYVDEQARWRRVGAPNGAAYAPCRHREYARGCNWAVVLGSGSDECLSCRLTRADLSAIEAGNEARWYAAESAKRRLLYTLLSIRVPIRPKRFVGDIEGVEFVWQVPHGEEPVLTGHDDGTITMNLLEADDDHRESARVAFGEPLRTVLGHLRHEVAHFLDQRFVDPVPDLGSRFLRLMGDKTADYPDALKAYYASGAPAGWQNEFISEYASAHPWEDWAETCAHYLLIVDAVETAAAWGLRLDAKPEVSVSDSDELSDTSVDTLVIERWLPVSRFLNSMARAIGLRDSYPFVIAPGVVRKLRFVKRVLDQAAASGSG